MASKLQLGIVDNNCRIEVTVVAVGSECPQECGPYPADGGMAIWARWVHPETGGVLHVVIAAPTRTMAAVSMCDLEVGDVVLVEGRAEQWFWPGMFGEIVVMCEPRALQRVRKRDGAATSGPGAKNSASTAPRQPGIGAVPARGGPRR